jgi:hypothetical protein
MKNVKFKPSHMTTGRELKINLMFMDPCIII